MWNFKWSSLWNDDPTESSTSSTTFRVSDKKASRRWGDMALNVRSSKTSICSQLKPYIRNHCTKVLMESQYSSRVRVSTNNGFVGTVIDCYNKHHNLVIRPDDIWTVILTQFSFYINNKAEEFRSEFVNFDGKKELLIEIDNSTLTTAPYDLLVTKTTDKIHENLVDKTIKDWIMPNFTTTTPNDTVVCGTIFMAVTKTYFDFGWHLMCGIPYITLEGTLDDWQNISDRLEKLKKYKLDRWYDLLKPILEEFIAAKRNQVNVEFWNRICHHLGGYSGVSLMSGWLTAFAIFDEYGNWTETGMGLLPKDPNRIEEPWPIIDINQIPSSIVTVDVKITDVKDEYEAILIAGHVGYEALEGYCTMKPQIGWGIALKPTVQQIETLHRKAQENNQENCKQCGRYFK